MKLYLMWSGERSRQIAKIFRRFLAGFFFNHKIEIYFSERDIKPAEAWWKNMLDNLKSCNGGLLFLTKDGSDSPWLMYEVGGLCVLNKKVYVLKIDTPEIPEQVKEGQAMNLDKDGLKDTIREICSDFKIPLSDEYLDMIDFSWSGISQEIQNISPNIKPSQSNMSFEHKIDQKLTDIDNKLEKLTRKQIREKHEKEIQEQPKSTAMKHEQDLNASIAFENDVINALKQIFGNHNVKSNVSIKGSSNIQIDVIVELSDKWYVIEIRYAKSHAQLQRSVKRLNDSIEVLKGDGDEIKASIIPLIIAHPQVDDKGWRRNSVAGVPVLKFDPEKKNLLNLRKFMIKL